MTAQEEQTLPPGITEKTLQDVYRLLKERPISVHEISVELEKSRRSVWNYIKYLDDIKMIEKIPYSGGHYQLANHKYEIDLNGPIEKIPHINFRDIPRIKTMFNYALGSAEKLKNVSCFERFCYGEIVKKFKINPEHWQHPKDTERLYQLYKEQYRTEYPPHYVKALRQFLSYCLRVTIPKGSIDGKLCGLVQSSEMGKYRHVKFQDDKELDQAIDWLESDACKKICEDLKLQHRAVLAHFSYSFESFGRPSRNLTIETAMVEKHPNQRGNLKSGVHLQWLQLESKQKMYFPKQLHHPRLLPFAIEWLEKRRALGYKFLFIDDSNFVPRTGDSSYLSKVREPYAFVYKRMFEYLGHPDWTRRALYNLRHCGINYWIGKLGLFRGLAVLQTMGWTSDSTLRKFYASITPQDIAAEINTTLYGS